MTVHPFLFHSASLCFFTTDLPFFEQAGWSGIKDESLRGGPRPLGGKIQQMQGLALGLISLEGRTGEGGRGGRKSHPLACAVLLKRSLRAFLVSYQSITNETSHNYGALFSSKLSPAMPPGFSSSPAVGGGLPQFPATRPLRRAAPNMAAGFRQ